MGRQIADTAASSLIRDFEGTTEVGYSYSACCLAGLPHRDQPADKNWPIETDFARLLVPLALGFGMIIARRASASCSAPMPAFC